MLSKRALRRRRGAGFSCNEEFVATLGGEDDGNVVRAHLRPVGRGACLFQPGGWGSRHKREVPGPRLGFACSSFWPELLSQPSDWAYMHTPQAVWDLASGAPLAGAPAATGFVHCLAFLHCAPTKFVTGERRVQHRCASLALQGRVRWSEGSAAGWASPSSSEKLPAAADPPAARSRAEHAAALGVRPRHAQAAAERRGAGRRGPRLHRPGDRPLGPPALLRHRQRRRAAGGLCWVWSWECTKPPTPWQGTAQT